MERIERLQAALRDASLDAICIRDTANIAYLSQFEGVFDEERAHALLVDDQGAVLHTDSRYASACRSAARLNGSRILVDDEALSHAKWLATRVFEGSVGIEDGITLAEYRTLEEEFGLQEKGKSNPVSLRETTNLVLRLRSVKDAQELERMRGAQAITDAAFTYIVSFVRPGLTERGVQRELDNYMLSHGAQSLAFPTIAATGPNGANPHAQPGDARLEAGQCMVLDFGAKARGYCSDMTRMVFLGQPDARLAHAYEVLREANEQVEAMLAPGVTGVQAHQHALDVLAAGGFEGAMGHGLGHGVGMQVHELPVLSPRNSAVLELGNVVTVEPGIYVEGEFGMRLEDFGVVTADGFEVFTQSTHEMVVV